MVEFGVSLRLCLGISEPSVVLQVGGQQDAVRSERTGEDGVGDQWCRF